MTTTEATLTTRALNYLARREYSRKELAKKLMVSSTTSIVEELPAVLDKLEQQGYLSAQRVVEQTIRNRRCKFGHQRIVYELKEKGIDGHIIDAILPELKETELDAAYAVWQKKFGNLPIDIKTRNKQTRFLINRGFSLETIRKVLSLAKEQ